MNGHPPDKPSTDAPKVSVLVVSYNQDRFISEAIHSALVQRTDFNFEIVIGDDCSSDRTRQILSQIRVDHGDKVRLLLHENRMGPRGNVEKTLEACHGEYIAFLDGDDYWLSPEKLSIQSAFLDAHPDCPLCCHNARYQFEEAERESMPVQQDRRTSFLGVENLLVDSPALSTTTMLRRSAALALRDIPKVLLGDKMRAVVAAHRFGPIGYIDEILSAWRVHSGGVMNNKWQLPAAERKMEGQRRHIEFFEAIDSFLDYQYHHLICREVVARYYVSGWLQLRMGNGRGALEHLRRGLAYPALPSRDHSPASVFKSIALLAHSVFGRCRTRLRRPLEPRI